jgi:hypothetical protein
MFGLSKLLHRTKESGSALIDRLNNTQQAYQLMDIINEYDRCITNKKVNNSKDFRINPQEGRIVTLEYTLVEI